MLTEIEVKNPIKSDYTAKVYVPAEKLKEIQEIRDASTKNNHRD